MRVSGKDKYCFNKQLAEQLFRIKKTRKKNDNSTSSADYEFLDESDESHFDLREDVFSREAQENNLEEGDRDYEFDTLGAVMNGTFRDLSKTHPVHDNIKNTAFATLVLPDGHTQVVSKQSICWFLEGMVWKNSSDRKWRFAGCPSGFFKRRRTVKKVEKTTLKNGLWAVFITADGRDYLLGQVLSLVAMDGKSIRCVNEWNVDEKTETRVLCQWYNMVRENGKLTGKLTRTFMFSNGYYSCKYYICTCPIPKSVQLEDEDGLLFDAEVVNQLSRFCQFKE